MPPSMYRDIEGELHPRSEVSKHHVYARSLAIGGLMKKFINQRGLTPMMLDPFHKVSYPTGLHRNVPLLAPPPPTVVHRLNEFMDQYTEQRPYDRLIGFVEFVGDLAIVSGNRDVRRHCGRMAENLECQMPYILEGQVANVTPQEVVALEYVPPSR